MIITLQVYKMKNSMKNREIRKCVGEITDKLYFEYPEFADFYCSLNQNEEVKLENEIYEIIKKRFDKILDK